MRRAEFVAAGQQLLEAVRDSGLAAALLAHVRQPPGAPPTELLTALQGYTVRLARAQPATRRLARAVGLEALEQPATWARLLGPEGRAPAAVWELLATVRWVERQLPAVLDLWQDGPFRLVAAAEAIERSGGALPDGRLLRLRLAERGTRFSTPRRLAAALEAVTLLYELCAQALGQAAGELRVVACDSGSDKEFALLGAAEPVAAAKTILVGVWERVVLLSAPLDAARLSDIVTQLPLVRRWSAVAPSPEGREVLRRRLVLAVARLLAAGAWIPEMEGRGRWDPQELLVPSPRLLAPPLSGGAAPTPPEPTRPP